MCGLLTLLPENCYILLMVGTAICLMIGIINRKAALGFISMILLLIILSPFIESAIGVVIDSLNTPMFIVVILILMIACSIWIIGLVFGQGAKDHFVGEMLSKSVIFIIALPFRIIGKILKSIMSNRRRVK